MITFPAPVAITLPVYPASVTLEIDLSPDGLIATVDVELLVPGSFIPKPIGFGNNFENGTIRFENIAVDKGDTLIATTRVTSISTTPVDVSVDHTIDTKPPQNLSSTVASGMAEKYYAEFIFS